MTNTTLEVSSTGGSIRYQPFVLSPATALNGPKLSTTISKTVSPTPLHRHLDWDGWRESNKPEASSLCPGAVPTGLAQRFFRQAVESDDAHDFSPPGRPRVTSSSPRGRLPLAYLARAPCTDAMPWLRARCPGVGASCE